MEEENEIRYPSQDERRKVLFVIAVVFFAGFVCLAFFQFFESRLYELHQVSPDKVAPALQNFFKVCSLILFLFMAGLAAWLWTLGSKIKKTGVFPPPEMAIVKPVPVRRGKDAELYWKIARFSALMVLLLGLVFVVLLLKLAKLL